VLRIPTIGLLAVGYVTFTLVKDLHTEFPVFAREAYRGMELRRVEPVQWRLVMAKWLGNIWNDEQGQDVAEYAVMLAVILVIVVGTIRLIGSNANNVFSSVGSAIQ